MMVSHWTGMGILLVAIAISCIHQVGAGALETEMTWYAPFLGGGGYCSEATSFMFALDSVGYNNFSISHHGDSFRSSYYGGLTDVEKSKLQHYDIINKHSRDAHLSLQSSRKRSILSIDVCHSEPGAWHAPQPKYRTTRCPSDRRQLHSQGYEVTEYNIGRTMFETDRIPDGWPNRLNFMDEVWVPTEFAKQIFLEAGVAAEKLVVVGEAVDTDFYRPVSIQDLSDSLRAHLGLPQKDLLSSDPTVFLFVGKFETRKGLHMLLRAYYTAFTADDNVLLIILTSACHTSEEHDAEVSALLDKVHLPSSARVNPPRYVVLSDVKQEGMPYLYSLADALVIPSHGEGWGRPHMEAMSCGTPVVATNWSGPTAFIDSSVGYPLSMEDELVPAEGWRGHYWAQPNVTHLTQLLRDIHANPQAAAETGTRARELIKTHFSLPLMGERLVRELGRIERKVRGEEARIERSVGDEL